MLILQLIEKLKDDYSANQIVRKNGTILLGPDKIPKARHMFYKPLSDEIINEYLIKEYANLFPLEYIEFLKYTNGMDLFMSKIVTGKVSFASSHLTVYGLPRTSSVGRPTDEEEPFDVRFEDSTRPNGIPKTWLKFGSSKKKEGFGNQVDLYIDTLDGTIISCDKKSDVVVDRWDNFDTCLCDLFNKFLKSSLTYTIR